MLVADVLEGILASENRERLEGVSGLALLGGACSSTGKKSDVAWGVVIGTDWRWRVSGGEAEGRRDRKSSTLSLRDGRPKEPSLETEKLSSWREAVRSIPKGSSKLFM